MPRKSSLKVTSSTGNVFRDLGFSVEEAEHLVVRADLLIQLQKALASRGLLVLVDVALAAASSTRHAVRGFRGA